MTRLLDPLFEASEGGASPRRRSLADSMIAGRRKASDEKADSETDQKKSDTSRGGRRRSRSSNAEPAADKKADARDARAEGKDGAAEGESRAPRRRRRSTAADREAKAAKPAAEERQEAEAEPTDAAASMPQAITGGPDDDGQGTMVERAMRASVSAPAQALPATTEVPADLQGLATEVSQLRGLVEQQRTVLAELRAGMLTLGRQVDRSGYRPRLGVFVDVPNLIYGFEGAQEIHMGRLLDLLREGRQLVRATAYSPVSDDPREPLEQQRFVAPFVPYDYRIVTKPLKRFADGSIKGNFDVELAIDMLSMADRVDVVAVVSGDADFARAVEAVQSRGVRVEVVAFAGSTSLEMRAISDHYIELGKVIDQIT